jgi:hypothetical protein
MDQRRGGLTVTEWLIRHMPRRGGRAAGLGVGSAQGELDLLRSGAVESFDLFDIAPELIRRAANAASASGLDKIAGIWR